MMPLGISYSASALVGNNIGCGNIQLASRYAKLTVGFDVILTTIILFFFMVYQDGVSTIFTTDPKIVGIVKNSIWIISLYVFFDTIHGVQSGVIRGLGR